jgi:hypothetical protein
MKGLFFFAGSLLLTAPFAAAQSRCGSMKSETIEAQAKCVDQGGVSVGGEEGDVSNTFSCLESKAVQNRCGPDGNLTRLRAFQTWLKKVKSFEASCTAQGGQFAYADPNFMEPTNETFCDQAVPETSSNMFEDSLCNFHSRCPAVKVICEPACSERTSLVSLL